MTSKAGAGPGESRSKSFELLTLSGKGGTGKTTVAAALIVAAGGDGLPVLAADCDVDAANLHLLLRPRPVRSEVFVGGDLAVIDPERCTRCGACREHCRFGALADPPAVNSLSCEGCGVCVLVCPSGAARLEPRESGTKYESETAFGPMVHARLFPGQGNSGKLVAEVRKMARELGARRGSRLIVSDGPPGLGCQVISAVTGVDLVLIVAEPSVTAHHDLLRTADVCRHFGVRAVIAVNKADLYAKGTARIIEDCANRGLEVLGEIPFSREIAQATADARPLSGNGPAASAIRILWSRLRSRLL
jgi:MinD superfamily P-loop ATPase